MVDRVITFPGQLPLETDILETGQFGMIGLGKFAEAVLGRPTAVDGLVASALNPRAMAVNISPGSIYQLENVESSQMSSLPPDTRPLVKQGVNLDTTTVTVAAPSASGQSQIYLIQASYAEQDTGEVVRPYHNAADPENSFEGPGGDGAADNTVRKGYVFINAKAGAAVTNGQPIAPPPDPGFVGLYTINVLAGQGAVGPENIAVYQGAPFIPVTLPAVPVKVQQGSWIYVGTTTGNLDGSGNCNSFFVNLNPYVAEADEGMEVRARMHAPPSAGAAFTAVPAFGGGITRRSGAALSGGEWPAGAVMCFIRIGNSWQISGIVVQDVPPTVIPPYPAFPPIPTYGVEPNLGLEMNGNNFGLSIGTLPGTNGCNIQDRLPMLAAEAEDNKPPGQYSISVYTLMTFILAQQAKVPLLAVPNVVMFSASGTYTSTPGTRLIVVRGVGGGGAGGSSTPNGEPFSNYNGAAGGGGAGGEFLLYIPINGSLSTSFTIGAGGTAAAAASGIAGGPGGATYFAGGTGAGGAGGRCPATVGSTYTRGGGGIGGVATLSTGFSGRAQQGACGNNASDLDGGKGGDSYFGGGGAGGDDIGRSSAGLPGGYGAGGGGADWPAAAGAGGGGYVEIWEYF